MPFARLVRSLAFAWIAGSAGTVNADTWSRTLDGGDIDGLGSVGRESEIIGGLVGLPDGDVIVVGTSRYWTRKDVTWLVRVRPSGDIAWQEGIDDLTGTYPEVWQQTLGRASLDTAGTSLLVPLETVYGLPASARYALVRVPISTGRLAGPTWTSEDNGWDTARAVAALPDGDAIVVGDVFTQGHLAQQAITGAWVVRVRLGSVNPWAALLEAPGACADAKDIALLPTGDVAILGHADIITCGSATPLAWVSVVDPADGSVGWTRILGPPDGAEFTAVAAMPDGGVVAAGRLGTSTPDAWLVRFAPDGSIVWQVAMDGTELDQWRDVIVTTDGGIVVAGVTFSHGAGNGDAWLARFSAGGALEWQRAFGGTGVDGWYSYVVETSDGSLMLATLVGSLRPSGWDAWLLRLDSSGHLAPSCGMSIDTTATVTPTAFADVGVALSPTPTTAWNDSSPRLGRDVSVLIEDIQCRSTSTLVPNEVSPPWSRLPLRFMGPSTLAWEPVEPSGSEAFRVRRGDLAALPDCLPGECLGLPLAEPMATDAELPGSGRGWFYLVSGINAWGEGSTGRGSDRLPRPAGAACP